MMFKTNRKQNHKGISLVETILSAGIGMGIISLVTGSLVFFNTSSIKVRMKNDLQGDLRNASNRIQKEVLPGRSVLVTYNGEYSFANELVLTVPTYDSNGYPTTTNGKDLQNNDVMIIKQEGNKLKFSLVPAPNGSSRPAITKQVLLSDVESPYPVVNGKQEKLFTYLSDKNEELTGINVSKAAVIKVVLWSDKSYGGKIIKEKEETNIRLRNYGW
jgi:hypothetical protein